MKTFWAKKRSTLGTEEVFGMPCPVQRCYNFIKDRPVAVVAARGKQVVVVLLTIWLSFTLKEISRADFLLTVCANKVFGVPCAAHRSHHLSHDRFTAGSTDSFRHSLHSQFVEVRLQAAQHVVQLVHLSRRSTGNPFSLGHYLKVRQ